MARAFRLALDSTGNSNEAGMPRIAIATRNSMRVNSRREAIIYQT